MASIEIAINVTTAGPVYLKVDLLDATAGYQWYGGSAVMLIERSATVPVKLKIEPNNGVPQLPDASTF